MAFANYETCADYKQDVAVPCPCTELKHGVCKVRDMPGIEARGGRAMSL